MTIITDAQAQHAQFTLKHNDASVALAEARTALKTAQQAREALLDAIATGAQGKSAADLAAAEDAIRTARHEAELHEGLTEAAKRAKGRSQVALWQVQAEDIKTRLRAATDDQLEAGKALDAAMEVAKAAADAFNALSVKISAITQEGHYHDLAVLQEGVHVTALGAHQNTWPRTRIQGHPPQQPVYAALHQHDRGWPVRDITSAEQAAQTTRSFFGTNLNAA